MLKKYKTLVHSCIIQVKVKKGYRSVEFRNGFIGSDSRRGGVFYTDDVELQKGIESHPLFNNGAYDRIWTDDVEPKKEAKAAKAAEEVTEAPKAETQMEEAPKAETQMEEAPKVEEPVKE